MYFRQLLSGRDFARGDMMARQMVNFVYLIGDRATGEAVIVDPAYAVQDLLDIVEADGMRADRRARHALPPGSLGGTDGRVVARGHQRAAREGRRCRSTCRPTRCRGSSARPASVAATWSATTAATWCGSAASRWSSSTRPGHTPGSQCFLVDGRLVAGDTLFLEGCGRTDLPGVGPARHVRVDPHPPGPRARRRRSSSPATSTRPTRPRAWATPGAGTTSSGLAPPRSGWPCSAGEDVSRLPADGSRSIVVGASLAGWRAVETLRAEGFEGKITLVGEELHLPYDRPPLSKQVLAGTWPPEKAVLADRKRSSELAGARGAGSPRRPPRRRRRARCRARRRHRAARRRHRAGHRGRARAGCPAPRRSSQADGLFTLRTLDDSLALRAAVTAVERRRVVVIGAGFIGAEVASTCAGLGCRVTVLEAMEIPLSNVLGPVIGAHCGSLHGAQRGRPAHRGGRGRDPTVARA